MRLVLGAFAVAVALLGLATCAGDELEPAPRGGVSADRFAVIALTYAEDADPRVRDQLVAQAYFVEHVGFERADVLQLLNFPVDALVDPALPVERCLVEQRDLLVPVRQPASAHAVRLLDAGELMVETAARAVMLDSHYFPDVYRAVSGLAYDGVLNNSRAFAAGRALTVHADGSDEVGELSVTLAPPPVVHIQSVGGEPTEQAHGWPTSGGVAGGLEVTWRAPRGGDVAEPVVVRYTRRGFDQVAAVLCVARDDGAFTLPEAALDQLPDLGPDQIDRLTVERVRAVSFAAPGMPDGLAVAIARDAVVLE